MTDGGEFQTLVIFNERRKERGDRLEEGFSCMRKCRGTGRERERERERGRERERES